MADTSVKRFSVLLYRLYFAPKATVSRIISRWPSTQKPFKRVKTALLRYVLPKTRDWLQVQKGLSQGMWMCLALPDEARYWRGEHEPEVDRALSTALYEGAVVYDIGAHLGYFELGAARLVANSGRVFAFDGDPDNVVRLRENAFKNNLGDRLNVVHAAVWSRSESDVISFRRGVEPRAQGGVEAEGNRPVLGNAELITVPTITLDAFIAAGAPWPHLIKVDVEGGEYQVLLGATHLFSEHRPVLIAEVHGVRLAELIGPWLNEHRYIAKWTTGGGPMELLAWPAEFDGQAWMHRIGIPSLSVPSQLM